MSISLTSEKRRRLAEQVRVNPATLYQALTGKGAGFSPAECVRIERESGKELRRWHLRPKDWHLIWPELIEVEGAPPLEDYPAEPGEVSPAPGDFGAPPPTGVDRRATDKVIQFPDLDRRRPAEEIR